MDCSAFAAMKNGWLAICCVRSAAHTMRRRASTQRGATLCNSRVYINCSAADSSFSTHILLFFGKWFIVGGGVEDE